MWFVALLQCVWCCCSAADLLGGATPDSLREALFRRVRCGPEQGVDRELCGECLSAERMSHLTLGGDSSPVALSRASYVFLERLASFRTSCGNHNASRCVDAEECRSRLLADGGRLSPLSDADATRRERLEALEGVLREVKAIFEPDAAKQCFSAERVLNEVSARSPTLASLPPEDATVLLLMSHLYAGECIDVGESVADFLDDIFLHYGDGCERVMTQSGFAQLWNDLQMQRRGKHVDHGVQNSCMASKEGSVKNATTLVVLMPHTHGQDPAWSRSRVPPSSDLYVLEKENNGTRRVVRHTAAQQDHEHKNLANECLRSADLLQRFLSPGNQVITSSEFLQLCPALVQQAVSGVCSGQSLLSSPDNGNNETVVLLEATQGGNPWFAVASVSVITAVSLLGLFLLPVLKKSFFVHINAFFTGLAFGTMSGDVVMHLMPQYLGLHQHDAHDHDHASESLFPTHLRRQLAFLLTMYLLFLVECIFTVCATPPGGPKESHHGHSHGPVEIALKDITAVGDVENGDMAKRGSRCTRIVEFLKPSNLFTGMSSKAAVIVLADTVHNFADGMAIAVGFSTSYKDGLSTSVAVFFHELPHEIGDFAVLMNCGLGYWKAFVFNLLSGLTAFLGLGVGLFAASLFREWLLCITAGLFFFVVMAEMLPDMRLESKEKWPEFAVKVTGTVCGIITMIVIAVYELSSSAT